ncbi:CcdB family protein [Sulfurisoma sediminicola]|uniref:Toxin CcdB n=1 Tax=Sulfurisoma sediminicola TaxID=1381557 RepID=A0A497XER2_9PROT|nr:CcdB family protein [Sulfurisoma sediminicola]RLJ64667.1 toxin CcdB [Sulfurisoma sediminicola]
MAHLDVYPNRDPKTRGEIPYVLEVQSDLLGALPSAIVVPLALPQAIEQLPILRLNPKVGVGETALIVLTQDLAALPRRMLKQPVANLSPQRDEILAALDFLFTGF